MAFMNNILEIAPPERGEAPQRDEVSILSTLLSVSQAVASIRDKDELLKVILREVQPVLGFDKGAQIFIVDPLRMTGRVFFPNLFAEMAKDPVYREFAGKPFMVEETPCGEVGRLRQVFRMDQETMSEKYPDYPILRVMQRLDVRGCLIAPLRIGGELIGSLYLFHSKGNFLAKEKYAFFQSIADQLAVAVANILSHEELRQKAEEIEKLNKELTLQNSYLIEEVQGLYNFEEIIGRSKSLEQVFDQVRLVGITESSVLLLGETGTGKELIARAIHNLSPRKSKPLIKLNCAALPAQLIESELFGHERGAFTGATERRIGKFEVAEGSTLFLDEVGELPLELQAKLLRALQEKEIERLGSNRVIRTDVRIIAATNRDLEKEVALGKFRSDLYFRLNVFPVALPSLRERRDDIPLLVSYFIQKMNKRLGKEIRGVTEKVLREMIDYPWPGNIRELEHIIERSVIVCKGRLIRELKLPLSAPAGPFVKRYDLSLRTWEEQEREYILFVLRNCQGKVSGPNGAATLLDLPATTLESKMKKLGIRKHHYAEPAT
jgi:formate hydrogenlyase transcriptional activator